MESNEVVVWLSWLNGPEVRIVKLTQNFAPKTLKTLTLKCHSFYLARELQCVIISVVYIPPSARGSVALNELHNMINRLENSYPACAFIIVGDHRNLRKNMYLTNNMHSMWVSSRSTYTSCH